MIPMVSPERPAPPVYEVTYSGALERARIVAQQRPAPPIHVVVYEGTSRAHLLFCLEQTGRVWWSVTDLVTATGLTYSSVLQLLTRLRGEGAIDSEHVAVTGPRAGRKLRVRSTR